MAARPFSPLALQSGAWARPGTTEKPSWCGGREAEVGSQVRLTPGWKWIQLLPRKAPSFSDVCREVLSGLSSPLCRSR